MSDAEIPMQAIIDKVDAAFKKEVIKFIDEQFGNAIDGSRVIDHLWPVISAAARSSAISAKDLRDKTNVVRIGVLRKVYRDTAWESITTLCTDLTAASGPFDAEILASYVRAAYVTASSKSRDSTLNDALAKSPADQESSKNLRESLAQGRVPDIYPKGEVNRRVRSLQERKDWRSTLVNVLRGFVERRSSTG